MVSIVNRLSSSIDIPFFLLSHIEQVVLWRIEVQYQHFFLQFVLEIRGGQQHVHRGLAGAAFGFYKR